MAVVPMLFPPATVSCALEYSLALLSSPSFVPSPSICFPYWILMIPSPGLHPSLGPRCALTYAGFAKAVQSRPMPEELGVAMDATRDEDSSMSSQFGSGRIRSRCSMSSWPSQQRHREAEE
ncbi:hypothetical protein BD414DRAFT_501303 [Trametes punicea]|nr:hypothetical protein BD414DRAFT_501303 [Trametes punicea]